MNIYKIYAYTHVPVRAFIHNFAILKKFQEDLDL